MFGLIERDIEYIVKAMKKFNEIEKAIVLVVELLVIIKRDQM